MGRRFKLNKKLSVAIISVTVLIAGVMSFLVFNNSGPDKQLDQKNISENSEIIPNSQVRIDTSKKLDEYISSVDLRSVTLGDTPKDVDWTKSDILAVEYSLYVGRTIEGVEIEKVDGTSDIIVVTVKEAPQGCSYPQVNEINILFVTVPKSDKSYKIFQKITPNATKCDF